ncbi:spen family transcriptional repressor split ends isoform X2 [Rhodnius prolixus]|uniref:spen family transcriptional repressor split ends isoform X2 n=1 Tax=Rhodnius prolixus TaxID=13249 RepID=UPI003D18A3AA
MVRETRHLWVGNLPENIREDRIRDHFKRYGRVQSVKLLPRGSGRGNGNGGGNDSTSTSAAGSGGSSIAGGGGGSGKDEDSGGGANNNPGTAANSSANNNNSQGLCATVSFMDIKSAAKAHHSEQKLDDRTLTTEYHEPAAIPGATSQLYSSSSSSSQQSSRFSTSHGSSEEVGGPGFDRSSHFYDRSDSTGSVTGGAGGGTVGGGASNTPGGGYLRRTPGAASGAPSAGGYHSSADAIPPPSSRSRTRDRLYRNGPYPPLIDRESKQRLGEPRKPEGEDLRHSRGVLNNSGRTQTSNSSHHRVSSSWAYECPSPRYTTNQLPSSTPELPYCDERRENAPVVHKKHSKSSISRRSGSDSGSNSGSSRSRSSSASSQSGSSTCSTASSSPAPSDKSCSTHSQQSAALRTGGAPQSTVSTNLTNSNSPAVHSEDRRPLAICVRNLPARSSDTSLKDGLYHEYKKHGKVTWVKVVGQGVDRYALVCFKKPDDVDKALQVSHDKLFFGCKIEVAPYQGYDVDDNEFRPFEAEQDEFHPKATRTLFIGNLEKDTTAQEIRKHFEQFGEIIDIDVKKQGTSSTYAFCQFSDISSVVRAMRTLDGEHVGQNRIKLGFGKSMHTNSVWVDGVADTVSEKYLSQQFGQFGPASHVVIDRSRGHALVFYEQIAYAQQAVKEMRGVVLRGRKLQVDYASRECQEAFYDRMDKQTNSVTSSSSTFDNSVQTTTTSSINNLRVFDSASNTNSSGNNASGGRYTNNSGSNTVTSSSASCNVNAAVATNRYSGNIGNRTTTNYVRSNSSTANSPATGGAQPTVSSINQGGLRTSTTRQQVNSSSTGQRFDYSTDYVQDRRSYRSYEDSTNAEDPGGGTGGNTAEVRHLQKERISGIAEGGGTSPAALVSSTNSTTAQEESRRRCNKHRRSESNSGNTSASNVGGDTGSGAPSRPGTPLCDERPENLPVEPRRTPRDRSLDPLSLPLPRFAAQVLSPRGQPARPSPPASPSHNFSSSDSEPSPPSPEWEERLRSLDERYEKWSGSRSGLTKIDPSSLKIRHKLLELDVHELPPSDIVKSVLAKRSVFDEDSKRLENFGDKYEPKEFIPAPRTSFLRSTSVSKSSPGLQYPFPSHPPVQPTTSVATTTAPSPSVLTSATEVKPSVTFLNCTRPQHIQPKISSPTVAVSDTTRSLVPTSLHDKFKTKVKTEQPVKKENPSPGVTPTLILPSPTINTPPKPKLSFNVIRRDSTDEKPDSVRRKSRDESLNSSGDNNGNITGKKDETNENDKVREAQVCERRKSVSTVTDKRRSSLDSKGAENLCEPGKHQRESTDKKEDRRRSSSELSEHHATQSNAVVHHKTDTKRIDSLTLDGQCNCTDLNEKATRKVQSENLDKRRDIVEHSVVRHNSTEVQDKKKEISERDRRRARESTDSSHDNHNSKYSRKVPENKKEPELSSNISEKREDAVNKQIAGESSSDKKRESLEINQTTTMKHREKKEHHVQDKEKRRDSSEQTEVKTKADRISPDNVEYARHKEQKRAISEQSTKRDHESIKKEHDVEQKTVKKEQEDSRIMDEPFRKESETPIVKHKDSDRRRNSENEISKEHSLFKKVFGFAESLRLHKERRDSDTSSVKTEETGKHRREHSTDKEKRKEKETTEDGTKHKVVRRSPDNPENNRHKEDKKRQVDVYNRKIKKENENNDDSKQRDIPTEHTEMFHSKNREDKKKEERRDIAASKSLYYNAMNDGCDQNTKCNREPEKKKDFNSSLIDNKKLDDTDSLEVSKKESDCKKETDCYYERRKDIHSDITRNRDSERRKSIDKYYENEKYREPERKKDDHETSNYKEIDKKNDSSSEKFKHVDRHRDTERKRDENLENSRTKDSERKRDVDSHERHKSGEKRKDFEGHRLKEEKKSEDGFEATKLKENERKNEEISYDRMKLKEDGFNRFKDYIRKKESDNFSERKKDSERRKEREHQDIQTLKECLEDRKRESEKDKKRGKEYDLHEPKVNGDHDPGMFTLDDCRKTCVVATYDESEHRVDSLKKEKRRERNWPAAIGCKRRLSSQDSLDINDDQAKRSKPERRDSKDSGRSSGSSRKGSGEKHSSKGFKLLEEKIKEDKEREQRKKEEVHENNSSALAEDKIIKPAIRKEKRNSGEKRKEDRVAKFKSRPRENGTASESDLGSGDDEAKSAAKRQQHSIFDIVDDEPAYISMYDKVKARSTKNMQKQEEEKRQEKLKEKFHQLKASRAKREEKKRSTSYDEDSDSEKGSCRRNKLLLTSSEEDGCSETDMRMRTRKILYDTSEDDTVQTPRARKIFMEQSSDNKSIRKIVSDVSEDDTVIKHSTPKVKSSRNISFEADSKSRKIMSDTSEDDAGRHNPTTLKLNPSRIQSDESETDLGFEDSVRTEPTSKKDFDPPVCDIFRNRTVEVNHFKPNIINEHQEQVQQNSSPESLRRNSLDSTASEQPRKKSHKKKQKRQKTFEENEEGSVKKHSSKKEKKKSHRDNDGDEEKKSRRKRSDREGNNKIDEKFEDIFGSLSDDSEKTMAKWQVSQVYDTDSESERESLRKKEKKRREKKLRELDEAGRAIEAKLMENTVTMTEEPTKIKKKKRKKSRDEKIKHHQQRIEQEEAVGSILPKEETDQKCNIKIEPDLELVKIEQIEVKEECRSELPHLGKLEIKIEADSENETKASLRNQSISSLLDSPPPTVPPVLTKKPEIPGFGSEVDESIHETAVKSISESPRTNLDDSDIKFDDKIKSEEPPPTVNEEKPTPVISQEETEDAVAALLVDAFGGGFEGYAEDTPKPDTPVSEPDLQIDTDTEDTFDTIDFSKPPRTPDIPASYYARQQNDTREGLEERIMSLACSADSPLKDNKPLPMPRTPDVVFDKKPATPDIDMSSSDSEKYPDKQTVVRNLSDISHLSPNNAESTNKNSKALQQPSSNSKLSEHQEQTANVNNKDENTNSLQKSLVCEQNKNMTSTSKIEKVEDLTKEPEVPKLTLLIPQNVSTIQTSVTQHNAAIPTLSPISKSSESSSASQASNAQNYQKLERISQVMPKPQPSVLVQQPQPQTAQVVKPLSVQVINSSVAKSSEQPHGLQVPSFSVNAPKMSSPKQLSHNPPQTQGNLAQVASKQSSVVQSKAPTSKTIIMQQSVQQMSTGLAQAKASSQLNNVQLKPQPAQHNMPAQHATAAQHALLKTTVHRLPTPYPAMKSNVINAHPHLVQPSAAHLIPIKVNTTHQSSQPQPPVQATQPVVVPISAKAAIPPLLPTIKDSQTAQHTTTSNNSQKQLHIHVNQQGQHSPHSPQPIMSPQSLKVARPVSTTQPPPLQSISVHHIRNAPHIQQAPPRSPNPSNVPLLQTVNVSGEHGKSSQGYLSNKQMPLPLTMVNCHNLINSPNNQAPHPEKVIALSPSNPFQQHQQAHSPISLTQKTSTAVNVIKSSSVVNEPPKVVPTQESNLDTNNKEEKNKLVVSNIQSSNQQLQINSLEKEEAVIEQSSPVNKTIDEIKKSVVSDDSKPLNAVIQDLTLRAASKAMWKQQSVGPINDTNRPETTKPIEQVVLALHKKATAIPSPAHTERTEVEKQESPLNAENSSSDTLKVDESSFNESKSSKHDTSNDSETDPQSPKPNSSLDIINADPKDQSETCASERNDPMHTSSSDSAVNLIEESNQVDQNCPETDKVESQKNVSESIVKLENNCISSNEISQDKEQPMQIARKSPTPLAEKRNDRKTPADSHPDDDEGPDPKTPRTSKETPPDVLAVADEKAKPDIIAPTTPVTTRPNTRGGRRRKGAGVGGRGGGGVATRRTRLANSSAPSPISTDVYEFRDDPEEERPRLILTIKSPPEPAASSALMHTTPATSVQHESVSATASATTPTTTTRKSRRLQEKDGSRTTIDETIDDVVRGNRPGRRTTRSSALSLSLPSSLQPEATRKSPRRRQQAIQQQQQQQQQQSQSSTRQPSPAPSQEGSPPSTSISNVVTSLSAAQISLASGKQSIQQQLSQAAPSIANSNAISSSPEPTTLIDPVTGLLIPMTESEEGQYVPLHSETNRSNNSGTPSTTNKEDGEPAEKRARLSVQSQVATTLPQPAASTGQPPPQLPVPQQQPLQQQNSSPAQERAHGTVSLVPSAVSSPTMATSRSEETVGRTISTAVTTAAVTVTPCVPPVTPSRPSVVRPVVSTHSVVASHGLLLPQGKVVPSQTGTVVRPSLPITTLSQNTPPPLVASIGSTSVHQTRMSSNISSSTSITPVAGASVTAVVPKAHLLQAANVRPSPPPPLPPVLAPPHGPPIGMPTPVAPKAHLLQVVGSSGSREGVVGSSAPHQGAMLTGSVASPPPLRAHQQPIVTGASSARVLVKEDRPPPPQSSRLLIKDDRSVSGPTSSARLLIKEDKISTMPSVGGSSVPPPRVLVKESGLPSAGCIVGIAGSPQPPPPPPPRGQVMQAGMPVPAYEASLHGVVAELLPNPQWPRQSPPPAHQHSQPQQQQQQSQQQQQQQQGDVVQHVNYGPHHIQPAHYVHPQLMYQQYLREAALGGPYNRPLGGVVKTDLDDRPGSATAAASALVASPPLELRRGSPHDRTTDSPQVATVYMHHNPANRHHVYYDGPPPPPAHRPQPPSSQSTAGRLQTPPHAGQAPPQADSLLMLLQRYPVMWQGLLALKNDQAAVQMHFVFGNHHLAQDSLPHNSDGSTPPLRIAQRMRLEQTQVEGVARKMQIDNEHCMLLALPCGRDHLDVLQQSNNLQNGFITYLQQKQAAGIVNIAAPGSQQAAYVVHIFPACEFANESLARIAPDLLHRVADLAHLLIVIATV